MNTLEESWYNYINNYEKIHLKNNILNIQLTYLFNLKALKFFPQLEQQSSLL